MVCHTLGVAPDMVVAEAPDTSRTPDSGTTTASRQTLFAGEAAVIAAKKLGVELEAARAIGKSTEEVLRGFEGREFYGEYSPDTDPMGSEKPNPVSHVAYGYAAQVVELDGQGAVVKVTAAYDVGTVVNPKAVQGQIEGGVIMGMGYGLTEDFPLENGYPKARFGTLGLIRATEVPEIEIIIVGRGGQDGQDGHGGQDERDGELGRKELHGAAYGAKGVGELAAIPTAPAIQGAYYRFDGNFRRKLPMDNTYYRRKQ